MPRVVLVAAVAQNGVIGRDGGLPWRLRADLAHFKRRTVGRPILMGRRTWESLPGLLPRRRHVVLSTDAHYAAPGATVAGSLDAALAAVGEAPEVCVIGGAAVYAAALPRADELVITHVDADVPGDTYLPPVDLGAWRPRELGRHEADADNEHPFRVVSYLPAAP